MKKFFSALILTIIFSPATFAEEKIGSISCNVIREENTNLSVEATVLKSAVDIQLISDQYDTEKKKILKEWRNVPFSRGGLGEVYENDQVFFFAFYDDVGGVSELRYEGTSHDLECEFRE